MPCILQNLNDEQIDLRESKILIKHLFNSVHYNHFYNLQE